MGIINIKMELQYKLLDNVDDYTPAKRDWLEKRKKQPLREQPSLPAERPFEYWPNERKSQEDKDSQRGTVIIYPDGTIENL